MVAIQFYCYVWVAKFRVRRVFFLLYTSNGKPGVVCVCVHLVITGLQPAAARTSPRPLAGCSARPAHTLIMHPIIGARHAIDVRTRVHIAVSRRAPWRGSISTMPVASRWGCRNSSRSSSASEAASRSKVGRPGRGGPGLLMGASRLALLPGCKTWPEQYEKKTNYE